MSRHTYTNTTHACMHSCAHYRNTQTCLHSLTHIHMHALTHTHTHAYVCTHTTVLTPHHPWNEELHVFISDETGPFFFFSSFKRIHWRSTPDILWEFIPDHSPWYAENIGELTLFRQKGFETDRWQRRKRAVIWLGSKYQAPGTDGQ